MLARRFQILDVPGREDRKRHSRPVPLWGGAAVILSFWLVVGYLFFFTSLLDKHFANTKLLGAMIGSALILFVGLWDDVRPIAPWKRLIVVAVAAGLVVLFGVHLDGITNPMGGILSLDSLKWSAGPLGTFFLWGDLLVFFWIIGMSFTSKILDGLDGLTTGIILIGSLAVYLLSLTKTFYQADTALLSIVLAGVCLGFLFWNFAPAKIFLGESGSMFLGYMLGVLAVIAGGKIATALLVMAVPILDMIRVVWYRRKIGHPVLLGDRSHLHFRLVDAGLTPAQAVILLYALAILFGSATLFFSSFFKLLALLVVCLLFVLVEVVASKKKMI